MVDDRGRLASVLRELEALGVRELFLDRLTAADAAALLARGADAAPASSTPNRATGTPSSAAKRPDASTHRTWREALAEPEPEPEPEAAQPGPSRGQSQGPPTATGAVGKGALSVLAAEAAACTRCGLAEGRRNVVFGRGSESARLVVVGEAPGSEEDRTGLPFVGPAGKLLDLLLLSVGFDRESVYICNVLKCRPPNNRNPLPGEVEQCGAHLHGQLDAIAPAVLLAVGKFAAQTLTGTDASIGSLRGRIHSYRGVPVVATYHPAYLLRTPAATRKTWQDFQLMRQVLDESA